MLQRARACVQSLVLPVLLHFIVLCFILLHITQLVVPQRPDSIADLESFHVDSNFLSGFRLAAAGYDFVKEKRLSLVDCEILLAPNELLGRPFASQIVAWPDDGAHYSAGNHLPPRDLPSSSSSSATWISLRDNPAHYIAKLIFVPCARQHWWPAVVHLRIPSTRLGLIRVVARASG